MTLDEEIRAALIAYTKAHVAWKGAQDGAEKVEAKQTRGKRHSELLSLGKLAALQEH